MRNCLLLPLRGAGMVLLWGMVRVFGFGFGMMVCSVGMIWKSSRCIYGPRVAVRVVKNGSSEVCHGASGPPSIAKSIKECYTLLEFVGGTVDVDFETSGTEMPIHHA